MSNQKPKSFAEAHANLAKACAEFITMLAVAMRPVLQKFIDEGLITKDGQLTPKAKKLIKDNKKL